MISLYTTKSIIPQSIIIGDVKCSWIGTRKKNQKMMKKEHKIGKNQQTIFRRLGNALDGYRRCKSCQGRKRVRKKRNS